jgi:hypothetical protein
LSFLTLVAFARSSTDGEIFNIGDHQVTHPAL